MRRTFRIVSLIIALALVSAAIYDYLTTSKAEALQITDRYIAAASFKWKAGAIRSEEGNWVVELTPVEQVKEAEWLYIDKRSGTINRIESTE